MAGRPPCKLSYVCMFKRFGAVLLIPDCIQKDSNYIVRESEDPVTSFDDLIDELPDNSPRYVVLSYPMKTPDGRLKNPLVLLYWRPPTCGQEAKMLYAGAVELVREKAGVSQYVP